MPDAAIEADQLLVSSCEAMSHELGPSVIAAIDDPGHPDIQRAAMTVGKFGHEAAQSGVDCQRTRLVNNTPSSTANNRHGQPAAMAVTAAEAQLVQVARVAAA